MCVCVCVCLCVSVCVVCVHVCQNHFGIILQGVILLCNLMYVCRYDSKCDVWSIGCILWDMANRQNKFVFVSQTLPISAIYVSKFFLCVQELGRNLGHKVSQASDSLSASNIYELIENNIPQVHTHTVHLLVESAMKALFVCRSMA